MSQAPEHVKPDQALDEAIQTGSQHARLKKWIFHLHYLIPRSSREYQLNAQWLKLVPVMLPEGDALLGKELLAREFKFFGESFSFSRGCQWKPEKATSAWLIRAHSFEWITDIKAYNDSALTSSQLREYIFDWIEQSGNLPAIARHPTVIGQRVAAWLTHAPFILSNTGERFQRRFIKSLARQTVMLIRAVERLRGRASFAALQGLLFASYALPHAEGFTDVALQGLVQSINTQLRPDGGHVTRSPSLHLDQLEHLINIHSVIRHSNIPERILLEKAIHSMQSALAFFQHGDGKLALFNDTVEERTDRIRAALKNIRYNGPAQSEMNGFARVSAEDALLLAELGVPVSHSAHCHFGTLSFEFSEGAHRIFVNCGAYRGPSAQWRRVCKSTSAHSALSVADENAFPHDGAGGLTFLHEPRVDTKLSETPQYFEVDATYNGYEPRFGLVHQRAWRLHKNGACLEGVDQLSQIHTDSPPVDQPVQVRFHLHPMVKVTRVHDNQITISLPSGSHWVFSTTTEHIPIVDESVYAGDSGKPQKSTQIFIETKTSGHITTRIGWLLRRDPDLK